MMKTASLTLACAALLALTTQQAQALPISPTFDVFGPLPGATFGGTGIPNDAVAIKTIETMGNTITLGLTATQRFGEPAVTNDGAGTFTAQAGGFPGSPSLARWNFNYFINIDGTGTFDDFVFKLLYDFDPAAGTDESVHGVLDFNAAITAAMIPLSAVTLVQDSQNLGFSFLAAASSFIAPPVFGAFDPNAIGEYTFSLRAFDSTGTTLLGESAIQVNTVPEPISASLFGIGALGLAIGGVCRRRKKRTA